MTWYYPAGLLDTPVAPGNISEMEINKVSSTEAVNDISYIAQYYCFSALAAGKHAFIQIPVHSNENCDIIMKQIAPHFNDIRIITYAKKVTEINLMSIKESTAAIVSKSIAEHNFNQIAYEMFGDKFSDDDAPPKPRTLNWFSVHLDQITKLDMDINQESLARFPQQSHLVKGDSFGVYVNEWIFEDAIKDKLAIRFLASFCKSLQFAVDANNKVTELRCF
ncbi:hypothetical protein [Paenibacillus hamazuiensis]|uniref:hypothetical protein n=1 Tax=Paenibacillus hamazuiensis TaxID=2936508 RepID=UPI00200E30AB|nr:hypothetical protein [Paenibacillus hamazuiensis]